MLCIEILLIAFGVWVIKLFRGWWTKRKVRKVVPLFEGESIVEFKKEDQ